MELEQSDAFDDGDEATSLRAAEVSEQDSTPRDSGPAAPPYLFSQYSTSASSDSMVAHEPHLRACLACRVRRVKCDKTWPACRRCLARGEKCTFGEYIPANALPDLKELERIERLEHRLATLEKKHMTTTTASSSEVASPLATTPAASVTSHMARERVHPIEHIYDAFAENAQVFATFFAFLSARNTSPLAERQLATPHLAIALSRHLVEVAYDACCVYLPWFAPYHARYDDFRARPDELVGTDQFVLAMFAMIGSRTSSHSAILGRTLPATGQLSLEDMRDCGEQRDHVHHRLLSHALELANKHEVLYTPSRANVCALIAFAFTLLYLDPAPHLAMSLIRVASGFSHDLSHMGEGSPTGSFELSLHLLDAACAAMAGRPCAVTDFDTYTLHDYEYDNGSTTAHISTMRMPDLRADRLTLGGTGRYARSSAGDGRTQAQARHTELMRTLRVVECWIAECRREYVALVTADSQGSDEGHGGGERTDDEVEDESRALFGAIDRLWSALDQVYDTLEHLNREIKSASYSTAAGRSKALRAAHANLAFCDAASVDFQLRQLVTSHLSRSFSRDDDDHSRGNGQWRGSTVTFAEAQARAAVMTSASTEAESCRPSSAAASLSMLSARADVRARRAIRMYAHAARAFGAGTNDVAVRGGVDVSGLSTTKTTTHAASDFRGEGDRHEGRGHHMLLHLVAQLDRLPDWVDLALPGSSSSSSSSSTGDGGGSVSAQEQGPTSDEIMWLEDAHRCASLYTSTGPRRLAEMKQKQREHSRHHHHQY